MFAPEEAFFSSYNQIIRKGELFKMVRVTFETHVSEVRKKVKKLTFEISIWVRKWQNYFFLMRACARGSEFFSSYKQNMRDKELLKIEKSIFKKTTLKYEKK